MTDHARVRELAAGFVLGALDPDDRRAFAAHLEDCEDCRREVGSLAPIPGLLSHVTPVDVEAMPAGVVDRAVASARSQWVGLARSRRAWRAGAVVAALAAILLAGVAFLPIAGSSGATVLAVQPGEVTGEVTIEGRAWGTAIHLELANLPQRGAYVAWVVDGAGDRQPCAWWGPTANGAANLEGASGIPFDQVTAVVVTSSDDTETLLTAVTERGEAGPAHVGG
ncbi:MAG TPA: zf-HC2 domain-containing protein [Acidimicrobiia bacterium]|nr:zf-HC2 domain-containing protein [Acidimicrobiia bacterium]